MNGRLEGQMKIQSQVNCILADCPDYMKKWYMSLLAGDVESSTCKVYISKVKRFLTYTNKEIEDINADDVYEYMISVKMKTDAKGRISQTSDSYRQGVWTAMNSFFDFMVSRKYIPENYMKNIKRTKNNDLQRILKNRIKLDSDDFEKMLDAVKNGYGGTKGQKLRANNKERDYCILYLLMSTGMRKTALTQINISDIDFENREITIIDKGDKTHVYYMTDSCKRVLNNYLEKRKSMLGSDSDALFLSSKGNRISGKAVESLVNNVSECALGYHLSPHKLRGGFVSIMFDKTGNIEQVRRMVGHSSATTTQRYITTDGNEKEIAQTIMSGLLG